MLLIAALLSLGRLNGDATVARASTNHLNRAIAIAGASACEVPFGRPTVGHVLARRRPFPGAAIHRLREPRGPTPDKPDVSVVNYEPGDSVSSFLNLRVADIQACHEQWSSKGAEFVTPPIDRGAEIRCYMRDPDGYMIEVGQSTGLLSGKLAKKRPEDLSG